MTDIDDKIKERKAVEFLKLEFKVKKFIEDVLNIKLDVSMSEAARKGITVEFLNVLRPPAVKYNKNPTNNFQYLENIKFFNSICLDKAKFGNSFNEIDMVDAPNITKPISYMLLLNNLFRVCTYVQTQKIIDKPFVQDEEIPQFEKAQIESAESILEEVERNKGNQNASVLKLLKENEEAAKRKQREEVAREKAEQERKAIEAEKKAKQEQKAVEAETAAAKLKETETVGKATQAPPPTTAPAPAPAPGYKAVEGVTAAAVVEGVTAAAKLKGTETVGKATQAPPPTTAPAPAPGYKAVEGVTAAAKLKGTETVGKATQAPPPTTAPAPQVPAQRPAKEKEMIEKEVVRKEKK